MVIPADWKEVRLGDLLGYEQPTKYLVSSSDYVEGGQVPVLTAGKSFLLGYTDDNDGIYTNLPTIIFDDFTTATQWVDFEFKVKSSACKMLRPKNGACNPRYVFERLRALNYQTSDHKRHWISVFHSMEMMMPPLKEQEAIAEALSDADSAIESLDALIAKKRDVKQATMQQLLTGRTRLPGFTADWKEVRLGDLGSTFGGLTGKSSKDFADGNSSFVTFMNVMSNVVLNNQGTEKVRIGNGERQSQLLEGDVIFNGSSETPEEVGFGSAVPNELSGLYLNSFCFGFRRKDTKSLDPKFFAYLTRSPLGRDIIRPMAQGSTRYNIAKTNLLNGRFPLPPLKEQEAIAEVLTVMDDELRALTEQVSKLRMVKEGMMQNLLTGKVRLV